MNNSSSLNKKEIKMSAKDFFLYLSSVTLLYIGFISLINLLFRLIETSQLTSANIYIGSVSWPIAALIVIFPLYLTLIWLILRIEKQTPEKKALAIRSWLAYLTLFLSGAIATGNLITLLYYFLDGRMITLSFLLKVISLFILTGLIFTFYLLDLKNKLFTRGYLIFGGLATLIVLLSIISAFMIVGTPAEQRAIRADGERINHLQDIQRQVTNHWQMKDELPENLSDLTDSLSSWFLPKDPETNADYEYERLNELEFELCATFNLAWDEGFRANQIYTLENWQYQVGRHCFNRQIDPERYPAGQLHDRNF